MALPDRFHAFIEEHALLAPGARVVVGTSGGLDSTVLLALLRERFEPVAAHVNYRLRGEESDGDEAFVRDLAEHWGVPVFVRRLDRPPEGPSLQAAARDLRYAFFEEVAAEVGAMCVATAHHRDDQAETVLLNLFRGAGPAGLAGLPSRRPLRPGSPVEVVRPLLFAARAEIEAFARAEGLGWREDRSNAEADYRRNVLRREVLPLVERHFGPGAAGRIAEAAGRLAPLVAADLDAFAESAAEGWALAVEPLAAMPAPARRAVLAEALRRWAQGAPRSAATVGQIEALLDAQPGRRVEWPAVTVWRDRERLVFAAESPAPEAERAVWPGDLVVLPEGTLRVDLVEEGPFVPGSDPNVELVDAGRLRFPLTLRSWQPGDALVPLGMAGRKKVSDLLTERRVPPQSRARQRVLLSGGEVVWVVGHRLAALFRLRPETSRAARLVWQPAGE